MKWAKLCGARQELTMSTWLCPKGGCYIYASLTVYWYICVVLGILYREAYYLRTLCLFSLFFLGDYSVLQETSHPALVGDPNYSLLEGMDGPLVLLTWIGALHRALRPCMSSGYIYI